MRLIAVIWVMVLTSTTCLHAKEIGVINFSQCMMKSKLGEEEKTLLEKEQQEVASKLQKLGDELQSLLMKLNDTDYLATLHDGAQQEMQEEFQIKNQKYNQEYGTYMKLIEEKKEHFFETISAAIHSATDAVAKKEGLPMVLNSEAVTFYQSRDDITSKVIQEMDQKYLHKQKEEAK